MTDHKLDTAVEQRLNDHLEAIDRALAGKGVPFGERRSVTGDVEAQIREMLAARCAGAPTANDLEAVLREVAAPESYAEEDAVAPAEERLESRGAVVQVRVEANGPRIVIGLLALASAILSGWWFAHNYFRIGPEYLEPVVLIAGSLAILGVGAWALFCLGTGLANRTGSLVPKRLLGWCLVVAGLGAVLAGGLICASGRSIMEGIIFLSVGTLMLLGGFRPTMAHVSLTLTAAILALAVGYASHQSRMVKAHLAEQAQIAAKMAKQREQIHAQEQERWRLWRESHSAPLESITYYPKQMALMTKWMTDKGFHEMRDVVVDQSRAEVAKQDYKWFAVEYTNPGGAAFELEFQITLSKDGKLNWGVTTPSEAPESRRAQAMAGIQKLAEDLQVYYDSIRENGSEKITEERQRISRESHLVPLESITSHPRQMALLTEWMIGKGFRETRVAANQPRTTSTGQDYKWFAKEYMLPAGAPATGAESYEVAFEIVLTQGGELFWTTAISSKGSKAQPQPPPPEVDQIGRDIGKALQAYYDSIRDIER